MSKLDKEVQCSIDDYNGKVMLLPVKDGYTGILLLHSVQKCYHLSFFVYDLLCSTAITYIVLPFS